MSENILDDHSVEEQMTFRRRSLLPVWIKIFTWIFMIFVPFIIPVFIAGIWSSNFELELYGYKANKPLSVIGISLFILFLLKGIVAYSLWFEKRFAIDIGLVDAIIGLLICTISMLGIFTNAEHQISFAFRVEIVLLIPYLLKLHGIRRKWRAYNYATKR